MAFGFLVLAVDLGISHLPVCSKSSNGPIWLLVKFYPYKESQRIRHVTFIALFRSVPELRKQPFSFCLYDSQTKASWMCFSSMKIWGRAWAKDLRTKAVSLKGRKQWKGLSRLIVCLRWQASRAHHMSGERKNAWGNMGELVRENIYYIFTSKSICQKNLFPPWFLVPPLYHKILWSLCVEGQWLLICV